MHGHIKRSSLLYVQKSSSHRLKHLHGALLCHNIHNSSWNPNEEELIEFDRKHVLHPYTSMTNPMTCLAVKKASGVHIELENGKRLIDGMSSWWACVHGYQHPVLDQALKEQAAKMAHVMFGGLTHAPAVKLSKLLLDITPTPINKVFLCDSGSVSVEVALKMAMQYWYMTGHPNKSKFVTLTRGYHGDTFGAMAVCDPINGMHSMFEKTLPKHFFVPTPVDASFDASIASLAQLETTLKTSGDEIAALILEPIVQGAGGMRFYSPYFLQQARKLCDTYNILLIYDEIATGFGRTGTLFACDQTQSSFASLHWTPSTLSPSPVASVDESVVPDIMCLGKALTGGYMTMGATLTTQKISGGISSNGGVFMHGPTFMGNPLASAVALASVSLLCSSPWQERIQNVRRELIQGLEPLMDHANVQDVRVLGGIGVCELKNPVRDPRVVKDILLDSGVWLRPFGKLVYTMPTFNAPDLEMRHVEQITQTIARIADANSSDI